MNSQDFVTELKRLLTKHPKLEAQAWHSENCVYSNYVYDSKDLMFCFDAYRCQNGTWLFDSVLCVDCMDCDYTFESEMCYECVDAFKCYNSTYLELCNDMKDSDFCYNSGNLQNCFGCVNLFHKSFCVFNRQLTEEQYNTTVAELKKLPAETVLAQVNELKKRFPIRPNNADHNVNCPYGNYVYNSKDCYWCFDSAKNEDCAYLYDGNESKQTLDATYVGRFNENSYQLIESARINNCQFVIDCNSCIDSTYLFNCNNVRNCFGCVGLSYKEYCILNRQFTQQEYEKILPLITKSVFALEASWSDIRH